jgi:hypothetical protein
MKQLAIALGAFLLTLFLPILPFSASGTPDLSFRNLDLLSPSTYTGSYYAILRRITPSDTPHEESIAVYAWQDHRGNMHLNDQDHQPIYPKSVEYDVRDQFIGHMTFPRHQVLATMLSVWLLFFGAGNFLLWGYARLATDQLTDQKPPHTFQQETNHSGREGQGNRHQAAPPVRQSHASPYQILGIDKNATQTEMTAAYRKKMMECHPDRVAHLGQDFQDMAQRKAAELNHAYDTLDALF